jgi:putative ABC transport system permease protein
VKLFEWVYERVFGNEAKLAAHNLKGNKSILNNITLLAIGISTLFMINTLSSSIAKDTLDYYKDFKYDIQLWVWPMDRETESKLVSMEGIEGTYGQYRAWGDEVVNKEEKVSINGVDPDKHLDYMNISMKGDPKKALKELNSGRNILLNELEKEKLQIEKGDILTLKTQKGILPYKVIGFFQSKSQKALVANRYLRSDMQLTRYDRIGIKTNQDAEEVVKAIQEKFKRKNPYVRTIEQSRKENMEGNKRIFAIFQGFSIMALVIGVFGVINNFIIGFMERRQALAIFRSVGMNKKQMIKMIFIEAFTGGLIGSLIGIFGGALLVSIIPKLLEPLGGHLEMYVSIPPLFVCVLMGSMITIIASISPALKSSKLNIIEAIKYE